MKSILKHYRVLAGHPSPLSQNKVHSVNIKVHSTPLELKTLRKKYSRGVGEYWYHLSSPAAAPKYQDPCQIRNFSEIS